MYCQVIRGRFSDETINFYDMTWKLQEFTGLSRHIISDTVVLKPKHFKKMKEFCALLSSNIPFIRVDFYESSCGLYFGELTFFPACGYGHFEPLKWNRIMGDLIKLPNKYE